LHQGDSWSGSLSEWHYGRFGYDPRDVISLETIDRNIRSCRLDSGLSDRRKTVAGFARAILRLLSARTALHARAGSQVARKAWWAESDAVRRRMAMLKSPNEMREALIAVGWSGLSYAEAA
jgi:hypothetical protein